MPVSIGLIQRGLIERDRDALRFQLFGRFLRDLEHVAEPENRDIASVLHHFSFADLEQLRFGFRLCADAGAARITNRDWAASCNSPSSKACR